MTGKTTDLIKDIATYGSAAFILIFTIYEVAKLTEQGFITGETAIGFFSTMTAAAVGFLFGVAWARTSARTALAGVNTPGPGSTTVNATGDTNVTGEPVSVTTDEKVKP